MTKKQVEKIKKFRTAIANGVKTLDKEFGRKVWLKKIDLKILDLEGNSSCVVGQCFGGFWSATILGKDLESDFAIKNGFLLPDKPYIRGVAPVYRDDYDFLTNLWYIKIVELKIKAGLIP